MPITSLDLSVLATPVSASTGANSRAPAAFTAKRVALPEKLDGVLATRLAEVRARKAIVDEKSGSVSAAGDDRDLKTSFTLYRALDALRTLSEAAASKTTPAAQRAQLNAQFQKGLADIQEYLAAAKTDKLTVQFGSKASKVDAVLPPRDATTYTGRTAILDGVTAADSIEIKLGKGTHSDVVRVDFSDISGPITLRAVADLVNSKIASIHERDSNGNELLDGNGNPVKRYASSFTVVRTNDVKATPATFGFSIVPGATERISLADPNATPAAYVVNSISGTTGATTAQLRRIDDVANSGSVSVAQAIAAKNTDGTKLAKEVYEATKTKTSRPPGDILSATTVAATAVDSQGFLYAVGSTRGALADQADTKADDIFLTKYDSNGAVVFSRKLGAAGTAQGSAITIDANDNVIVAGQFDGKLAGDKISGADTLVVKFDSAGREKFAVQLDSLAPDAARAITVDASGDIFVAGTVTGALPGQTSSGGQDGFVAKLSGTTGTLTARTQIGTSGKDSIAGLAIGTDGALLVAATENGAAVLHRFEGGDVTVASTSLTLGALSGGEITSLAVDHITGNIAVGGFTRSSLTADPLAGASDVFIARLNIALGVDGITQFGTAAGERLTGVQFAGGKIYASGSTSGDLVHARSGSSDAFLARLDATSGATENILQFGTPLQSASNVVIAVAAEGPGVLAKLGLRQGDVRPVLATTLVDRTLLREGDQFSIAVDGKVKTITVDADDDAKALTAKIKAVLQRTGDVLLTETAAGTKIAIRATTDARIDLLSGPKDRDALAKLNLAPGQLRATNVLFDTGKDPVAVARTPGGSFGLDLSDSLAIDDQKTAAVVLAKIDKALETTKRAYRSLYYDPAKEQLARLRSTSGAVPAYLTAQISGYTDALNRLTGGNTGVTA